MRRVPFARQEWGCGGEFFVLNLQELAGGRKNGQGYSGNADDEAVCGDEAEAPRRGATVSRGRFL